MAFKSVGNGYHGMSSSCNVFTTPYKKERQRADHLLTKQISINDLDKHYDPPLYSPCTSGRPCRQTTVFAMDLLPPLPIYPLEEFSHGLPTYPYLSSPSLTRHPSTPLYSLTYFLPPSIPYPSTSKPHIIRSISIPQQNDLRPAGRSAGNPSTVYIVRPAQCQTCLS